MALHTGCCSCCDLTLHETAREGNSQGQGSVGYPLSEIPSGAGEEETPTKKHGPLPSGPNRMAATQEWMLHADRWQKPLSTSCSGRGKTGSGAGKPREWAPEASRPGLQAGLRLLQAVWPQASYVTSLRPLPYL